MILRWIEPAVDVALYKGERRLRYEVLRRPLGMPEGSEENAAEARCQHCVAVEHDGRVVGCVLWLGDADGVGGKLLQMAVAEDRRGTGVGARLVRELERHVAARGVRVVRMHAREAALGFYDKLGYRVVGAPFTEVGLPHRHMQRELGGPSSADGHD